MTNQITIPRETWDAMREALERIAGTEMFAFQCRDIANSALTAANAVSHPQATEPAGWKLVPVIPTEEQWGGLARDFVMWIDMNGRKTPESLLKHLAAMGITPPEWLLNEPEMKHLDHSLSKGTRAAIIYRAMLAAAPEAP